uniref:RVP domain-containing protein n=1 Tax=Caenorhabditis japonica TaxID=281687 RepID=A0A8R1DFF9_CAEJA
MEGKILEALVDSGAAVSYMPLSSVRTKINSSIVPPAQAANGSSIPFLGTTQATIKIGDFYIPHTFLVSRDGDCPAPLLLGMDFVNEINKNHDFSINVRQSLPGAHNEKRTDTLIGLAAKQLQINQVKKMKVNSVKSAKLPHIDVTLDGQVLKALIDTGATVSYVSMSSVTGKVKTTHQPKAIAANSSSINFLGTTKAEIQIEHLIIPHTFLVSIDSECPAPILIGLDLTKKINKTGHEISMNLHSKEMRIGDVAIPINFVRSEEPIKVYPVADTVVAPRSEAILPAVITDYDDDMGSEVLLEDTKEDNDEFYVIGRAVVDVEESGNCIIKGINTSRTKRNPILVP